MLFFNNVIVYVKVYAIKSKVKLIVNNMIYFSLLQLFI